MVPSTDDRSILYLQGLRRLRAGDPRAAGALLTRCLDGNPTHQGARRNLIRALLASAEYERVLAQADIALEATPDNAELQFARGTALNGLGRPHEARDALTRATTLDPSHAAARLNLGNACVDQDDLAAAEVQYRAALACDPHLAEAQASLGYLLTAQGRLPEAIAACETAIHLRPEFAQAHWNLAVASLLAGDLPRGFREYEWRKRHDRFRRDFVDLPGPVWDGGDPAGRRILVHAEQGFGDTIQFARYLPLIAARGGMPILACEGPLLRLLAGLPGVTVVAKDRKLPDYDCWIDQMSLPHAFGTALDTIPSAGGYLTPEPGLVSLWQEKLPPGRKIGLVWAGNSLHSNDRRRSIPPAALRPLLSLPGIAWINLQIGPAADNPVMPALRLTDFADTAAVIANLDFVVTVDTSVAHLAGAIARPAWIMLPYAPDWRWLLHRINSPWYATLRLFRQAAPGDWVSVVEDIARALRGEAHRIQLSSSERPRARAQATRGHAAACEADLRITRLPASGDK